MGTDAYITEACLIVFASALTVHCPATETLPLRRMVTRMADRGETDRVAATTTTAISNLRRSISIHWAASKLKVVPKVEMDMAQARGVVDNRAMVNHRLKIPVVAMTTDMDMVDQGGRMDPEGLEATVVLADLAAPVLLAANLLVALATQVHPVVLVEAADRSIAIVHAHGMDVKEDADTRCHMTAYRAIADTTVPLQYRLVELVFHKATR